MSCSAAASPGLSASSVSKNPDFASSKPGCRFEAYPQRVHPNFAPFSSAERLLPLPFLPPPSTECGRTGLSRRRRNRRLKIYHQGNQAIQALNLLAGCPPESLKRAAVAKPSPAQSSAHRHILSCLVNCSSEPIVSPPEAARQLLGSHLEYAGDGTKVVDFCPSKVSLPEKQLKPVPVSSVLFPSTAESLSTNKILVDFDVLDKSLAAAPAKGYTDKILKSCPKVRKQFYHKLARCGILGLCSSPKEFITPFFVEKKQNRQRLVWDCRRSNCHFRLPPKPDMGAAESLQYMEVPGGEVVYMAEADIENCFYQCGADPELSSYFNVLFRFRLLSI